MRLKEKVISREINRLLWHSGKSVATAESCSCGRIAMLLSEFPGSSEYFKGGIVCYTDEMKAQYLKVDAALLKEKTAVCEEVAVAMVQGAIDMFQSDYALAMTGVAGPGGATAENPVGSIWIAWGRKDDVHTFHQVTNNGRDMNVQKAVDNVVWQFMAYLKEELKKD